MRFRERLAAAALLVLAALAALADPFRWLAAFKPGLVPGWLCAPQARTGWRASAPFVVAVAVAAALAGA